MSQSSICRRQITDFRERRRIGDFPVPAPPADHKALSPSQPAWDHGGMGTGTPCAMGAAHQKQITPLKQGNTQQSRICRDQNMPAGQARGQRFRDERTEQRHWSPKTMTVMTEEAERLNSQLHPPFPTAFFLHKMHTEVFKDQKKTCKEVSSSASRSLARFGAGKRPPVLSVITHRLCAGVKIKLPSKKLKKSASC